MKTKKEQAMRLYKAVDRLALQAGEETDEAIDWLCGEHGGIFKLYEAFFSPKPPQRTWVGLTDEDMADITSLPIGTCSMMLKVEAKLKEKNT